MRRCLEKSEKKKEKYLTFHSFGASSENQKNIFIVLINYSAFYMKKKKEQFFEFFIVVVLLRKRKNEIIKIQRKSFIISHFFVLTSKQNHY